MMNKNVILLGLFFAFSLFLTSKAQYIHSSGISTPSCCVASPPTVHFIHLGLDVTNGAEATVKNLALHMRFTLAPEPVQVCWSFGGDGNDCYDRTDYTCEIYMIGPTDLGTLTTITGFSKVFPASDTSISGGCLRVGTNSVRGMATDGTTQAINSVIDANGLVYVKAQESQTNGVRSGIGDSIEMAMTVDFRKSVIVAQPSPTRNEAGFIQPVFFSREATNADAMAFGVQCYLTHQSTTASDVSSVTPFTIQWARGEVSSKSCMFGIHTDGDSEDDETFEASVSIPAVQSLLVDFSGASTVVTIPANEMIVLAIIAPSEVDENAGSFSITVTRECTTCNLPAQTYPFSVGGTATNEGDFTLSPTTSIFFGIGVTSTTIDVTLIDDTTRENDETIAIYISDPGDGTNVRLPFPPSNKIVCNDRHSVVSIEAQFPNVLPPTIPTLGIPAMTIRINGVRFGAISVPMDMKIGDGIAESISWVSEFLATSSMFPPGAGMNQGVTVTRGGIADTPAHIMFNYTAPDITAHAPPFISPGSPFTIYGSNFGPGPTGGYPWTLKLPGAGHSGSAEAMVTCSSPIGNLATHAEMICPSPSPSAAEVGPLSITTGDQTAMINVSTAGYVDPGTGATITDPPVIRQSIGGMWVGWIDRSQGDPTATEHPASKLLDIYGERFGVTVPGGVQVTLVGGGPDDAQYGASTDCVVDYALSTNEHIRCAFTASAGGVVRAKVVRSVDGLTAVTAPSYVLPGDAVIGRLADITLSTIHMPFTAGAVATRSSLTAVVHTNVTSGTASIGTLPSLLTSVGGNADPMPFGTPTSTVFDSVHAGEYAGSSFVLATLTVAAKDDIIDDASGGTIFHSVGPLRVNITITYGKPLNLGNTGFRPYTASDTLMTIVGQDLVRPPVTGSLVIDLYTSPSGTPAGLVSWTTCSVTTISSTEVVCSPDGAPISTVNESLFLHSYLRRSSDGQIQAQAAPVLFGFAASGATLTMSKASATYVTPTVPAETLKTENALVNVGIAAQSAVNVTAVTITIKDAGGPSAAPGHPRTLINTAAGVSLSPDLSVTHPFGITADGSAGVSIDLAAAYSMHIMAFGGSPAILTVAATYAIADPRGPTGAMITGMAVSTDFSVSVSDVPPPSIGPAPSPLPLARPCGGTVVTVQGSWLGAASSDNITSVTFAGRSCATWSRVSRSTVLCTVSSNPSYALSLMETTQGDDEYDGPIRVDTTHGSVTSTWNVSYARVPSITAVSPVQRASAGSLETALWASRFASNGTVDDGNLLAVHGSRLGIDGADLVSISLAGVPCTTAIWNSSSLILCLPGAAPSPDPSVGAGPGEFAPLSGSIDVTTATGCSSSANGAPLLPAPTFAYVAPVVTGVSPGPTAGIGQIATIHGTNFGDSAADVVNATVNRVTCDPWVWISSSSVECTVPATLSASALAVFQVSTKRGGRSMSTDPSARHAIDLLASIVSVTPLSAEAGVATNVTITGMGLADATGGSVAGVSCTSLFATPTVVICSVSRPVDMGGTSGPVSVTLSGGSVVVTPAPEAGITFKFTPVVIPSGPSGGAPVVTAVVPDLGWTGDAVTLYGDNFGSRTLASGNETMAFESGSIVTSSVAFGTVPIERSQVSVLSYSHIICVTPSSTGAIVDPTTGGSAGVEGPRAVDVFAGVLSSPVSLSAGSAAANGGGQDLGALIVSFGVLVNITGPDANTTTKGSNVFSYKFPPATIHDVRPTTIPSAGGTISILGSFFVDDPSNTGSFAGLPCDPLVYISASLMTCEISSAPDGSSGSIALSVRGVAVGTETGSSALGSANIIITVDDSFKFCTTPCGWEAQCVDGECRCNPGFTGAPACETSILRVAGTRSGVLSGFNGPTPVLNTTDDGSEPDSLWIGLATAQPVDTVTPAEDDVKLPRGDGIVTVRVSISRPDQAMLRLPGASPGEEGSGTLDVVISDSSAVEILCVGVKDKKRDGTVPFFVTVAIVAGEPWITGDTSGVFPMSIRGVTRDESPKIVSLDPSLAPMIPSNISLTLSDCDLKFTVLIGGIAEPHVILGTAGNDINSNDDGGDGTENADVRRGDLSSSSPSAKRSKRNAANAIIDGYPDGGEIKVTVMFSGDRPKGYHDLEIVNAGGTVGSFSEAIFVTDDCPDEGMFGIGKDCKECPKGGVCPGGNRIWPQPGYWNEGEESGFVTACDPPEACLGGKTPICAPGYGGTACGDCGDDFYRNMGQCESCPEQGSIMIAIICDCVLWISFGLLATFMRDRMAFSYVVMVVRALQGLAGIGDMGDSSTPKWVRTVYSVLHLFSGDYSLVKSDCMTPAPYIATFFAGIAYSAIIMAPAFLFLGIAHVLAAGSRETMEHSDPRRYYYSDRMSRMMMIGLTIAYLPVTTLAIEALSCAKRGDNTYTLITKPAVTCFVGDHILATTVACIILCAYTIAYPMLVHQKLRRSSPQDLHQDERFMERWNFFYEFYNPNYPTFWIVEYPIMCIVAAGKSALRPHVNYQMSISVAVFAYKLVYIVARRPFIDWLTDVIQALMAVISMVAINIVFFSRHGFFDTAPAIRDALSIVIFASLALVIFALVAFIVYLALFNNDSGNDARNKFLESKGIHTDGKSFDSFDQEDDYGAEEEQEGDQSWFGSMIGTGNNGDPDPNGTSPDDAGWFMSMITGMFSIFGAEDANNENQDPDDANSNHNNSGEEDQGEEENLEEEGQDNKQDKEAVEEEPKPEGGEELHLEDVVAAV